MRFMLDLAGAPSAAMSEIEHFYLEREAVRLMNEVSYQVGEHTGRTAGSRSPSGQLPAGRKGDGTSGVTVGTSSVIAEGPSLPGVANRTAARRALAVAYPAYRYDQTFT